MIAAINSVRTGINPIPGKSARVSKRETADPGADHPWDYRPADPVKLTHADLARKEFGVSGKGQTVVVIGSGFEDPDIPLKAWVDPMEKSEKPEDPIGDGTHMAKNILKIAPQADLAVLRVLNKDGAGSVITAASGIDWAVAHKEDLGIKVVVVPFSRPPVIVGFPAPVILPSHMSKAARRALDAGLVVVAAAGDGRRRIGSPAEVPGVIAVASAKDENTLSEFNNWGPAFWGADKPDVAAPGEYIATPLPKGCYYEQKAQKTQEIRDMDDPALVKRLKKDKDLRKSLNLPDNILKVSPAEREALVKNALPGYYPALEGIAIPGSRIAASLVAGVAALVLEANPDLTPQEVREIIMETAGPLGNEKTGLVDAQKAVARAKQKPE